MKIAMVCAAVHGGTGNQTHLLANQLVKFGHTVTLFTGSRTLPPGRLYDYRYVPVSDSTHQVAYILHPYRFCLALRSCDLSEFDVVHALGLDALGAMRYRHKLVTTFHGSALDEALSANRRTWRQAGWRAYQLSFVLPELAAMSLSRVVVGISQATKRRFPRCNYVVSNGVDLEIFRPGRPDTKSAVPSLLTVGSGYGGRKRLWWLHTLFPEQVLPRVPSAELWMVANRLVEGPHIRGYKDVPEPELVGLYQSAWVFCLPSIYEGFGVPYIEAMASGTPVVASRNPGAWEVLEGGRWGLIPDDRDLATTLVRLLEDGAERERYIQLGLERARHFDIKRTATRYLEIYQEII